jgi:hypothetical protein
MLVNGCSAALLEAQPTLTSMADQHGSGEARAPKVPRRAHECGGRKRGGKSTPCKLGDRNSKLAEEMLREAGIVVTARSLGGPFWAQTDRQSRHQRGAAEEARND